jgi:phage terminase small subunit
VNGADLRKAYEEAFEAETPAELVILDRACALLDQVSQMEAELEATGYLTVGGNRQMVSSPLLPAIRAHSAEISRLVRALGMTPESIDSTRARRAAEVRWAR